MRRRKAIFTPFFIPQNEGDASVILFFLDKWIYYYSKHFDVSDMYILLYGDKKKIPRDLGGVKIIEVKDFVVVNYHDQAQEIFNKNWSTCELLLKEYEYVVMTDLDEFLYHPLGIGNYIDEMGSDYVTSNGYELIHLREEEPPFDFSKKILEQRNFWYRNPVFYSKTLITNQRLSWNIGNHKMTDHPKKLDKELLLVHLHKYDYDSVFHNHKKTSENDWSEKTMSSNMNWHHRIREKNSFDRWFYVPDSSFSLYSENHGLPKDRFLIEKIPQEIKEGIGV